MGLLHVSLYFFIIAFVLFLSAFTAFRELAVTLV